jgi:sugar phosphate isomerase/epimerase
VGAKIAIEGYPGGPPHYGGICCSPETCRAFIKDVGAKSIGWNYDPSHLIRLGVDHVRFLNEFVDRVWHVHAKDTELIPEAQYELGLYQGSAFNKGRGFGEHVWRYTIPGHGVARWPEIFRILKAKNFAGKVSIELEDENFNGSEEGEKQGLLRSLDFLRSV